MGSLFDEVTLERFMSELKASDFDDFGGFLRDFFSSSSDDDDETPWWSESV